MTPFEIRNGLEIAIKSVANENTSPLHRQRKLPMETMLHLLIGMEGGSLAKELHRAGVEATPAAFSQRRKAITPEMCREVFTKFNQYTEKADTETYQGHHILAIDGTAINMSRDPNAPSFVCNDGAPQGYNQLHLNPLFDVLNKTYIDAIIQPEPKADEIGALIELLKRNTFQTPTIIIGDRGYESYNLLAHLQNKPNVDFLIRVKQNYSAMREVAKLPMLELDCDISFTITTTQTNEDKRMGYIHLQVPKKSKPGSKTSRTRWDFPSPYSMKMRIVRFRLETGELETIATSLPRTFTPEDIKNLYHLRWGLEISFRDMKYTLGLVNLHGRSDSSVEQESWSALTMHNFTSRIVKQAVIRQPKDGVYAYKANFKMAVALCREYFNTPNASSEKLLEQIARHIIPIRPGRTDERKLRPKGFVGFTYRVAA